MSTPCRLVEPVSRRLVRGVMWDGVCTNGNLHSTRWDVGLADEDNQAASIDYDDKPAVACERCGQPVPWEQEAQVPCSCGEEGCTSSTLKRFGSGRIIWNTEDGMLHPGDMHYRIPRADGEHWCSGNWSNCDGKHLYVVLPNGHEWDIDSRANNCTLPKNTTHRCWIRTGEPPKVTAGKAPGETCTAGAGSIQSGSYHGFLVDGVLT